MSCFKNYHKIPLCTVRESKGLLKIELFADLIANRSFSSRQHKPILRCLLWVCINNNGSENGFLMFSAQESCKMSWPTNCSKLLKLKQKEKIFGVCAGFLRFVVQMTTNFITKLIDQSTVFFITRYRMWHIFTKNEKIKIQAKWCKLTS